MLADIKSEHGGYYNWIPNPLMPVSQGYRSGIGEQGVGTRALCILDHCGHFSMCILLMLTGDLQSPVCVGSQDCKSCSSIGTQDYKSCLSKKDFASMSCGSIGKFGSTTYDLIILAQDNLWDVKGFWLCHTLPCWLKVAKSNNIPPLHCCDKIRNLTVFVQLAWQIR